MTTMIDSYRVVPASALARIWAVTKLTLANPWTALILPWIILAIIFLANLAIWALITTAATDPSDRADAIEGFGYSGSTLYVFGYMLVVAIQTVNLTFQYALGYGVTRRDFYLGSSLTFVMLAGVYAIGLTILAWIEQATNGWGFGGRMFTSVYFGDGPLVERLWIFFVAFLFFFFLGAFTAAIYVRWKSNGVVVLYTGIGALLIGVAAVITFNDAWDAFWSLFASVGLLGSFSLSLVVTILTAVGGYLVLRRATPTH